MTDLADVTSNIETVDISGDSNNTAMTISSLDIQNMVNDASASELTIKADSGDSLIIALDAGESIVEVFPDPFTPGVDGTYTISDGATVAVIHWDVVGV